jgi:hypothetical protein
MPANETALTAAALTIAIEELRFDIESIQNGIEDLEGSLPVPGTLEFRMFDRSVLAGARVQIRMDKDYLKLRQADLRRLERAAA